MAPLTSTTAAVESGAARAARRVERPRCYARAMSRSLRVRSWVFAVALLALGVTLGRYAPRWLELGAREQRWPDVITQVRELSRLEGVSCAAMSSTWLS